MLRRPPRSTLFPYTTLFRSATGPFWRPIKYSLFPPLGLATLAGYLPDDADVQIQDEHVEALNLNDTRSEEHTSELQSHSDLVCRLLLEKKKKQKPRQYTTAT